MIRQDIRIGNYDSDNLVTYKFIIDLYKAGVDFDEDVRKNFVMLRKYNITNNVIYYTDIYIIERDLINDTHLAYPIIEAKYIGFSSDATDFNENLNDKTYKIGGDEVYELYTKDNIGNSVADIPCDKLRIYHPHNKLTLESIIYVDTQIHDAHFHLLCRPYNTYDTNAENDFESDHLKYSEFIECWLPNIESLMSGEYFYNECLSSIDVNKNYDSYICKDDNGDIYAALKLLSLPFEIDENDGVYTKKYITGVFDDDVAHNYITYPLRVTISPYSYVDDTTHLYINDSELLMNSDIMQESSGMTLKARAGFDDNGNHAIIAEFDFPFSNLYKSFKEAYEHFYKISLDDYVGIVEYNDDDENDYVEQKQCGFILRAYSDVAMTQRIAQYISEINNPSEELDNFAFRTYGMFDRWTSLPDILVFRCFFVDRWLGTVITSNPVIISQESFRYFINTSNKNIVDWTGDQIVVDKIDDMKKDNINFIDKITCVIKKKETQNNTVPQRASTKVLYKPIFFRTQDLQTITLRTNLTQNIGVNLSEYMTKVETFKLSIGDCQFTEIARNDIYVIFSINSAALSDTSGTYHISNQDDEYISSGKYNIT